MNCFNCELEEACETCLDQISRKKTYFIDNNMLKRKLPNGNYQLLPYYKGNANLDKIKLISNLR